MKNNSETMRNSRIHMCMASRPPTDDRRPTTDRTIEDRRPTDCTPSSRTSSTVSFGRPQCTPASLQATVPWARPSSASDLAHLIKFPQKADEALIGILTRMRLAHPNPISKLYEHGNDSCECTQICLSSDCQASCLGLPRGLAFGLSASLDVCHKVDRHAKLQAFASSHDWHP